ncbi:MAG: hypothetical protein H6978_01770 [Gammaproteobacteria bacterium]|nr:hypothetical protein [Gammaproteobacteria bacterium]
MSPSFSVIRPPPAFDEGPQHGVTGQAQPASVTPVMSPLNAVAVRTDAQAGAKRHCAVTGQCTEVPVSVSDIQRRLVQRQLRAVAERLSLPVRYTAYRREVDVAVKPELLPLEPVCALPVLVMPGRPAALWCRACR